MSAFAIAGTVGTTAAASAGVSARVARRGVAAARGPVGSRAAATRGARAVAGAAAADRPVIIIDNYDSFTYNLSQVRDAPGHPSAHPRAERAPSSPDVPLRPVHPLSIPSPRTTDDRSPPRSLPSQYLGDLGCEHIVYKNDEKTVDEIRAMNPRGIMVSPGPGRPEDSGISLEVCEKLGPEFGVFGVCMGHQCIGQVFGGTIVRAPCGLMHGKSSPVWHTEAEETMLSGLPSPFQAARYHSLVISREGFPDDELEVTAWTEDETIMAVKHRKYPKIQGVQFHPESIITESGLTIIKNWVDLINA